jgi:hypothetical protein
MGQNGSVGFGRLKEAWKNARQRPRLMARPMARLMAIGYTVLAASALFFLAVGISQLELLPGQPLPMILQEERTQYNYPPLPGGDVIIFIIRVLYFLGLVLAPFLVIYLVLNPKARKQFLRDMLRIGAFVLLLYMIYNLVRSFAQQEQELGEGGAGGMGNIPEGGELIQFVPQTPPWLTYLLSGLLAVLIMGIIGVVLWLVLRRRASEPPLDRIAEEAQSALEAIRAGGDLRNIVIRCYAEMSRVLSETRGIHRSLDMTPHEFQAALERQGLPREPVAQLTHLFEEVRYGSQVPGAGEERRALDSLAAIVAACEINA